MSAASQQRMDAPMRPIPRMEICTKSFNYESRRRANKPPKTAISTKHMPVGSGTLADPKPLPLPEVFPNRARQAV